jgi:hypothetical protein
MSWTSLSTDHITKARKRHGCVWCGTLIEKGEPYTKYNGTYDGDFQTSKFHPECDKAYYRDESIEDGDELYPGVCRRGMTYAETDQAWRKEQASRRFMSAHDIAKTMDPKEVEKQMEAAKG